MKGDVLIVGINSDTSIRHIKGKSRPIIKEKDRALTLAGLESVDFITIFSDDTPLKVITALTPDVLVKGADWKNKGIVGKEVVIQHGGKVCTVATLPGRSTTNLIKKIASTK